MSKKLIEELKRPLGGFRNEQERQDAKQFDEYTERLTKLSLADMPPNSRYLKRKE